MLKITDNVTRIEKEVRDGDFNLNLKDHILYLPSFINPDVCKDVVNNLKNVGLDKSTPYTDGLLNDYTDSYFDPDIATIRDIKNNFDASFVNLLSVILAPCFASRIAIVIAASSRGQYRYISSI